MNNDILNTQLQRELDEVEAKLATDIQSLRNAMQSNIKTIYSDIESKVKSRTDQAKNNTNEIMQRYKYKFDQQIEQITKLKTS